MLTNHQDIILDLLEIYKNDPVVMDIKLGADDGGKTIDIIVDDSLLESPDSYPRKYKDYPICVLRKHKLDIKAKA